MRMPNATQNALTVSREAHALAVLGVDTSIPAYGTGYPAIPRDHVWDVAVDRDSLVVAILDRDTKRAVRKTSRHKYNVDGHESVIEMMREIAEK